MSSASAMAFRAAFVSYNETRLRIIDAYESTINDEDVEVDTLKVSVIYAISKALVKTPVRSTTCTHLQCFDLDNFIGSNGSREKMKCPVCNVEIEASQLVVDEYFQSVLSSAAEVNASEVELLRDGGFCFPQLPVDSAFASVAGEAIDLSDDALEESDADNSARSLAGNTERNATEAPSLWNDKCAICSKHIRNVAVLAEHTSQFHGPQINSLSCKICGEAFFRETARDNHEDTAHGAKTFKCGFCEKPFRMRTARTMHIKSCVRKKKFKRKQCVRSFTEATTMANRATAKQTKKKTQEANKRKWTERYLAVKQKLSTTQGKSSTNEPEIDVHAAAARDVEQAVGMSTSALPTQAHGHRAAPTTLQTTYPTCTTCGEAFFSDTVRRHHEKTAHNKIRNDEATGHGEKTFKCDFCEKSFSMQTARAMHIRSCARKKKKTLKEKKKKKMQGKARPARAEIRWNMQHATPTKL